MTDLFRPDGGDDPLERALRRSLAAHADDAPDAQAVTDRLLAAGAGPVEGYPTVGHHASRSWRTWGTPLVAAACVAAIVGIILAIVRPGSSTDGPDAADTRSAAVPSVVTSVPATPSATPTSAPTSATASATKGPSTLRNVSIVDLTFNSVNSGWALASADCQRRAGSRCTALLRTTDGVGWGQFTNTSPFDVPGVDGCPATKCVTHIRFADDSIGYAFGPDALFMTTDGAQHWTKQTGGADALETLDNNVIRVSAIDTGTPSLQTSALGGPTWTVRSTPRFPADPVAVTLSRSGRSAVVAFSLFDAAKGSGRDQSGTLLRSSNDGATWTASDDPCPFVGAGYTDVLVAATTASDGSIVADCATRSPAQPSLLGGQTITSTDGGATFANPPEGGKLAPARFLGAASAAVQLVVPVGSTRLYRSTDQGNSWTVVAGVKAADVRFLGFESATVGRLVTDDGTTVWTTRDSGATWTKVGF